MELRKPIIVRKISFLLYYITYYILLLAFFKAFDENKIHIIIIAVILFLLYSYVRFNMRKTIWGFSKKIIYDQFIESIISIIMLILLYSFTLLYFTDNKFSIPSFEFLIYCASFVLSYVINYSLSKKMKKNKDNL